MSTMITFAANNEFFRKRKRVHKACDTCKKRRKRCIHTFDGEDTPANADPPSGSEGLSDSRSSVSNGIHRTNGSLQSPNALLEGQFSVPSEAGEAETRDNVSKDSRLAPPRFIGYLNPEAVMRGHIRETGSKCGGWVQTSDEDANPATLRTGRSSDGASNALDAHDEEESPVEKALEAYLDAIGVSVVPAIPGDDVLLGIYFEYVHPLLPLINQKIFYTRRHNGEGSRMLLQAMCLVASRHERARNHLYLSNDTTLLEPREYARRLYAALVAAINHNLEKDRISLIQALALMSLYSEGTDGADQASMHLVQAIHHAHTLGLQFSRQRNVSKSEFSREKLFWCLWSLDKLNASMNGRPQYMHERDNQLEMWTAKPEYRQTPFGIWLQLAGIMDRVIELYRPGTDPSNTGLENDFPGFEEIIGDVGDRLRGPIVAALEIFYHAVAMVSHKSRSITDPVRSTPSSVRQSLSAVRLMTIMSHESPTDLPPLPIVPYALALAMSVAYRQFRRSKLQGHKNRAKEDLNTCCDLLNSLRKTWWCAGCMADLGAAALQKADKGPSRNHPDTTAPLPSARSVSGTTASQPFQAEAESPLPAEQSRNEPQANDAAANSSVSGILKMSLPSMLPGEPLHTISSERSEHTPAGTFDFNESPDWLNFDNAFENIDTLLGSGGADLSSELLRGFNWDFGNSPAG